MDLPAAIATSANASLNKIVLKYELIDTFLMKVIRPTPPYNDYEIHSLSGMTFGASK